MRSPGKSLSRSASQNRRRLVQHGLIVSYSIQHRVFWLRSSHCRLWPLSMVKLASCPRDGFDWTTSGKSSRAWAARTAATSFCSCPGRWWYRLRSRFAWLAISGGRLGFSWVLFSRYSWLCSSCIADGRSQEVRRLLATLCGLSSRARVPYTWPDAKAWSSRALFCW